MWTLAKAKMDLVTFLWSKIDSNYFRVKTKVLTKDDDKDFRVVQNLTMREAEFTQFLRFRNQLVIAAENFVIEENM